MQAVAREDVLASPTVGVWQPAIGVGAPLAAGQVLGTLVRAGRPVVVHAPPAAGVAVSVAVAGTWVQQGDALVTCGQGTGLMAPASGGSERPADLPEGAVAVRADTDGTVYLRPEPASPAFVAEGATVGARETLALVEVMKTFTPVRAPFAGRVARVLVDDTASIAAEQILLWLVPEAGG